MVRNIFDQYRHPENRLTHALATVLHEDPKLLKNFIQYYIKYHDPSFPAPAYKKLRVVEQSLPNEPEVDENDTSEKGGLPDIIIHDGDEWALLIENKISAGFGKQQLQRHVSAVRRRGFVKVAGLAITVYPSTTQRQAGWHFWTWRQVYSWAVAQDDSTWAQRLIQFFNIAEARMAREEYLSGGTLTEFSGIKFDTYTYTEGKRLLRLLTEEVRKDKKFLDKMRLRSDQREAIGQSKSVWDFIPFISIDGKSLAFNEYPHCTVGINENFASASITFPNQMKRSLRNKLAKLPPEKFEKEIEDTLLRLTKALKGVKGYMPFIGIVQRRYRSQRDSHPFVDGEMIVDLRVFSGDKKPDTGPRIYSQKQWLRAIHELLANKRGNLQMQIGVRFFYDHCEHIKTKKAMDLFTSAWTALRPLTGIVID